MSNSQALDIPKAVEKRLPECEAYVRSLSLSPEQKQMYAQAAKNRLSSTPRIFRGRRATLEAMAIASSSSLQTQGDMDTAMSVPTFLTSPAASQTSLLSSKPLYEPKSQIDQKKDNQLQRRTQTQVLHPNQPRAVESHATPQRGFP